MSQLPSPNISWSGPTGSPDYPPIMLGIILLAIIGVASAVFPIVEYIMSILLIIMAAVVVLAITVHILRERRLDRDAFYGPITEEKEVS